MKKKRFAAAAMTLALMMGLASCGKGKESSMADAETQYERIVYSYASFNNIPTRESLAVVEEAINEIFREKIGVEVTLKPIPIYEYSQFVSLALQGGEQMDIFESLGDFNVNVATNKAYDITELIDSLAEETKAVVGDHFLKTCTVNGKLYGIPTYKPFALTPMVVYRKDIADALNLDMTQVQDVFELTDNLRKVKQEKPDMIPLVPINGGQSGLSVCGGNMDYLSDDYNNPKGVLIGSEMTVVDYYKTDMFAKFCELSRTWYTDGLIMKDAATTTSTAMELMSAGNSFCFVAAYSYPTEDTAASLEAQCGGYELGAVQIGEAYLDTTAINNLTWMISSTTKAPEAAMKFLNLTFTDPDVTNLLIYGIEGRDYVMDTEGYVSYPDGQDAATVPYTAQLSCGTLGNYFIMHPMAGTNKASLAWEEGQNHIAAQSPALGFSFDSDEVKTAYTSVNNVIERYLPGLLCGSVDPETTIPEFVDSLQAAGLNKIIEKKQQQLDEWNSKNQEN